MIYTILGNKNYIDKEIVKLTKNINKENIVFYDLNNDEVSVKNIIIDLNTISLFDQKVVIIENVDKLDEDDDLIKYLDNPNDSILIMTSKKELSKKKIDKVIIEKTKVIDLIHFDLKNYVKKSLDDYTMSYKDINLLLDYCNNDIIVLDNELEKLKLYKIEDKIINEDDIKLVVNKSYDSTIFNLIDSINAKNIKNIHTIYKELLLMGETDEKIMYTIANHYRLLYQISIKTKDLTDNEILKEYRMHPYRLTKLKEQTNLISEEEMLSILKSLSDIDIDAKMGKGNICDGLFLFFERL